MKRYEVRHKAGGALVDRYKAQEIAEASWGWSDEHTITEIEWTEQDEQAEILKQLPPEFRDFASYYAYEQGHSAGAKEVTLILDQLVSRMIPSIKAFNVRLTGNTNKMLQS